MDNLKNCIQQKINILLRRKIILLSSMPMNNKKIKLIDEQILDLEQLLHMNKYNITNMSRSGWNNNSIDNLRLVPHKRHIHHIDKDSSNNDIDNIRIVEE